MDQIRINILVIRAEKNKNKLFDHKKNVRI